MPAATFQPAAATQNAFGLSVGGRDITRRTPVDLPYRITETADGGPNEMTFTIEDRTGSEVGFIQGEEVVLRDFRDITSGRPLFGGWLVAARVTRRPTAVGRLIECTTIKSTCACAGREP